MTPPGLREPRWRRAPEERPKQIIEAALEVFGEVGLARARLDDIARRAGVSKGTIYVYFPDKEELFKEVVRHTVIRHIERAEREDMTGTAREQLLRFMADYWHYLRSPEFAALHRLVIGELRNFPDLATFYAGEVIARRMRLITEIIRRGVERGELRDVEPEMAARSLAALFITHAVWCAERSCFPHIARKSDEEILAELQDLFLHAVGAAPGG